MLASLAFRAQEAAMPDPQDALAAEVAALRARVAALEQALAVAQGHIRTLMARLPPPQQQQQQQQQQYPPGQQRQQQQQMQDIEPSEPWNLGPGGSPRQQQQ
jgi:hypothetical protein